MEEKNKFMGCYVSSPPMKFDADPETKEVAEKKGELFRSYIWGENGIAHALNTLHGETFGKDLGIILFQFYVEPFPFQLAGIKEIEPYRKDEKSIGTPIIVNAANFFSKSDEGRYEFLKNAIMQKLDLISEIVKKRKLDTNMELLKVKVREILT
jgi:hypothetical protein